ncbi:MAG: RecQ family ATP-dependent DNA helicase [Spirochaetes bacterium]|nr:RecQ family ATP-dependent DNA helicase [Spirochaetota bacterium]
MNQKVLSILQQTFGYSDLHPGQNEIIDSVLKKKNTLGIMPTGGGKSLCYQIPALYFNDLTIVISPLISLMKDQIDFLNSLKFPAAMINSTVEYYKQVQIKKMVETGEIRLLYLTPERFKNPQFTAWLADQKVSLFTVDEAHCISEWGHDFRPEYRRLSQVIKKLHSPPVLALTATATKNVQKDIIQSLDLNQANIFVNGFNRENLILGVRHCFDKTSKKKQALAFIQKVAKPGIIYTTSIADGEDLYQYLKTNNTLRFGIYHGSLSKKARHQNQEDFLNNKIDILIATSAFGMGVNKKNIRFVLHYCLPGSLEAYYQETGRAGRDKEISYCLLLYLEDDEKIQRFFIESANPPFSHLIAVFQKLKNKAKKGDIYADQLDDIAEQLEINQFQIDIIIKQLNYLGCLTFEYMSQEKVEIQLKKQNINEDDEDLLNYFFSNTNNSTSYVEYSLAFLQKRMDMKRSEVIHCLDQLKKNKVIQYSIIPKGNKIILNQAKLSKEQQIEYKGKIKQRLQLDFDKLHKMIDYCRLTQSCRRKYLLDYFGEKFHEKKCGGCDICRGTYKDPVLDVNDIQQTILYFVLANDCSFGKQKTIKILKGSYDLETRHKKNPDYGALKEEPSQDIEKELNQLLYKKWLVFHKQGKIVTLKIQQQGILSLKKFSK